MSYKHLHTPSIRESGRLYPQIKDGWCRLRKILITLTVGVCSIFPFSVEILFRFLVLGHFWMIFEESKTLEDFRGCFSFGFGTAKLSSFISDETPRLLTSFISIRIWKRWILSSKFGSRSGGLSVEFSPPNFFGDISTPQSQKWTKKQLKSLEKQSGEADGPIIVHFVRFA